MPRLFPAFGALLALVLLAPTPTDAQPPAKYDAKTDRLRGLSRADLKLLEPYMATGPVTLVEFADTEGDELPAINVATVVHARPADVMKLMRNPAGYPRFMRTLDKVELVERRADTVLYDWHWRMALLELSGRNAMRIYEPPPSRADRGYRVTIDSQHGDLGSGRMSMRVLPHGAGHSMLVLSMRLDLRKANYVARKIARAARSINRSANMSMAYAMVLSLRREAERRAGYRPPNAGSKRVRLHKPAIDEKAVLPLLRRGDLVLHHMRGDELDQIAIFGLIHRKPELIREVMLDANAFGSALMPGSDATVVSSENGVTTFDWDIDLPLVGVSGTMRLRDKNPVVAIEATDGALRGGRWHFETKPIGKRATMMSGWARFDLRKSSWLLRSLLNADPYLGHGMTAASEVMLLRALRSRSRKKAQALAAQKLARESL